MRFPLHKTNIGVTVMTINMELRPTCNMFNLVWIFIFSSLGVQVNALEIKVAVLSDIPKPKQSLAGTHENNANVDRIQEGDITLDVTWYYNTSPLELISKAQTLLSSETDDVIVVDSHEQVYDMVNRHQNAKRRTIHWPAGDVFVNGISSDLHVKRCMCNTTVIDGGDVDCKHLTRTMKGPGSSKSFVIASLISKVITDNVFIIIQNNETTGLSFSVSELENYYIKGTIYDESALAKSDGILEMMNASLAAMEKRISQVLLLCDKPCVGKLLREANRYDEKYKGRSIMRHFKPWLVFSDYDVQPIAENSAASLDNVALVRLYGEKVHDTRKTAAMLQVMRMALYQVHCKKIKIKDQAVSTFIHFLGLYREKIQNHPVEYTVQTFMWREGRRREFALVAQGNGNDKVECSSKSIFPNMYHGFNKKMFVVATLPWPPFVIKMENKGVVTYDGFCMDLLSELARTLNFTYTFQEPADGQWGSLIGNTSDWTGLVGMMQRREADLLVAPVAIHYEREKVMDFTHSFYYEYMSGMMKIPDPDKQKWKTFLQPIRWTVLLCVIASLPAASLILFLIERFNPFYTKKSRKDIHGLYKVKETIWFMYGALLSQGGVHEPGSSAGRTLLSFWWLFAITIVALYSGNLIAFLTVTKREPPFSTLKGLLDSDFGCGTLGGTIMVTVFEKTTDPTFKKIWQLIQNTPGGLDTNNSKHVEKVDKEDYVYINDLTQFQIRQTDDCDVFVLEEKLYPMPYAIGLQNESPYLEIFTERIMSAMESGLLDFWRRNRWPKSRFCSSGLMVGNKPVEFIDIQSAFYLMAIGIVVAVFTLSVEVFIHKKWYSKKRD